MSVEILIYTYLAICAGMIVFNIVTVVLSRHKRLRSFSASIRLELRIADEIDRLPAGGEVSPAHLRYIERKLRRADNMAAFDAAMERLCLRRPAAQVRAYLTALDGVFIAMAERYCRRSVYAQSITDQGTGLMNRRAYEKYLCESENHGFASAVCIYIDANGLHEINNERGHEAGDRMLRMMADQLREQFPDSKIYRIGEDEFVVFPSDAQEQPCRVRMEEISARLAAQGYSISYGLAVRKEAVGLRGLVREADERMLEAKHAYYAARRRSPRISASAE